ncbi:hypothetical protein NM208_g4360 [Fusarium decemcellulare]|uniref:Uncharacterized protein n=2 Tax=Fusarium decemcellulare TaxID=57161 RepID=A0ACC1SKZ8_9HYPO|nr:hypothetical protein NM208_g11025 [Fusarium decemcellulare]KAJ3541940.1 hypothetical protein NM208_g4360 [Fusarium decemcellulare]
MSGLQPSFPPVGSLPSTGAKPRHILFQHPAYLDSASEMLALTATEGDVQDGVDYQMALISCCTITGNTWRDGWLARKDSKDTFTRVDRPEDGILREPVYYFRLGQHPPNYKYPVLPSFDHWPFPHDNIPIPWSSLEIPSDELTAGLGIPEATLARDESCRVTAHSVDVDAAYIIPQTVSQWFKHNKMTRYCHDGTLDHPINDMANRIILRRDLQLLFDRRELTFVAKTCKNHSSTQLVTHIFRPVGSTEPIELYRNRTTQPLVGIATEFLFARFVWALFDSGVFRFFRGTSEFSVLLLDTETGQHTTSMMRGDQVERAATLFPPEPSGKSRAGDSRSSDDDSDNEMDSSQSQGSGIDDGDQAWEEDSEPRGRRRTRSYD